MAITIRQSPTSPNMANADLIYEVSSNISTNPQYQFVMDIQDSTRTVLQRIKQQPNPSGYGVFDVGNIVANYVDIDPVWKTKEFATSSFANREFWIAFGEEYGTSTSGSVTLYNGSGVAGEPAKSGSYPTDITNGLVEINSGDWNFPSSSYYTASAAPTLGSFTLQHNLSYAPTTQKIQEGEYATIALYNGNFNSGSSDAQDIYYVEFVVYDATGSNIQTFNFYNLESNGGGPRANGTQEWGDTGVYNTQTASTRLLHIGVGPQNITDNGTTLNSAWSYYTVTAYAQESAGIPNTGAYYGRLTFQKDTGNCDYPGARFAWKNEFGVWDYYTAKLATNSSVQIERNSYNQSFVDFSTSTTNVPYNISRRGSTQFYNKLNQSFNVTTDILTQTQAEWLRELMFSPSVYIQEGTDFLPVIITNAEVIEKTNPRSQKVFQYTFNYEYANQLRPRL